MKCGQDYSKCATKCVNNNILKMRLRRLCKNVPTNVRQKFSQKCITTLNTTDNQILYSMMLQSCPYFENEVWTILDNKMCRQMCDKITLKNVLQLCSTKSGCRFCITKLSTLSKCSKCASKVGQKYSPECITNLNTNGTRICIQWRSKVVCHLYVAFVFTINV
jgi:hypothetical protein